MATKTRRASAGLLALAQLAEGGPPFMATGGVLLRADAVKHAHYSTRGGTEALGTPLARWICLFCTGVPPHADARVPSSAPPHRARIIVFSTSLFLETMRLLIDMAGRGWELRVLWRSAWRLGPALGFFCVIVLLVVAMCIALAVVVARSALQPALLTHHGPGWQGVGATHGMRAALPIDDLVQTRPVMTSRPSPARCTASSHFVQVAELVVGAVLPLR